jgi:alpha/beta superfamily hydrolase
VRLIQSHTLPGGLEAILEEPEDGPPRLAALVCHPHPMHGGTMHNKVVHRMARALRGAGAAVLRFNFRKTGEVALGVEDARGALDWLRGRYPGLEYALAGFSFGARVITRLGCEADGARFLLAAGFPVRFGEADYLSACNTPKIFVQSTHDQYAVRAEFEELYAGFSEPKELRWIEAPDHFFAGELDAFEQIVTNCVTAFLE